MKLGIVHIPILAAALAAFEPRSASAREEKPIYDERIDGDFGAVEDNRADAALRVAEEGVYVVRGSGTDAVDDTDAFLFEVGGDLPFDFCLVADAAEFKWLRRIDAEGRQHDVAFGSTNFGYKAPRNIVRDGLPPGKYRVDMAFGPDGATGEWEVKIGPRPADKARTGPLCEQAVDPTTAQKMAQVDWPGLITIFHGQNWGEDEDYVTAIAECGFGGTGAAEFQIEHCRRKGLRAFVFIWPHEAATIPAKHKDDKLVLCYYLSDRVQPDKWGIWANNERIAWKASPSQPAIFTMRGLWGGIEGFCPDVRGRAMEYYHYHWDGNRAPHMHFALLEQYRKASLANGHVPVLRIVETRPEDMRRTRQTIYTSLAYGVRGFRTGGRGIFDAERDGRNVPKRNAFGEEFLRINTAIKSYSPVFKTARSAGVYHVDPLPPGCMKAPADSWVQLEGEEVLVGLFRDEAADPGDYLVVANRDAANARKATLTIAGADSRLERMDKATGKWLPLEAARAEGGVRVEIDLEEGGGELLRVKRGG